MTQLCLKKASVQLDMASLLRGLRAVRVLQGLGSGKTWLLMLIMHDLAGKLLMYRPLFRVLVGRSGNEPVLTLAKLTVPKSFVIEGDNEGHSWTTFCWLWL